MASYTFSQVDVFGATRYRGNPLVVVHDADGLSTEQMQDFARWTNLSETTFLMSPTNPDADYRVRIFTASQELPFAGHPTLGSAHAWLAAHPGFADDRVRQQCDLGVVAVRRSLDRLSFAAPPMINSGPVDPDLLDRIVSVLGLESQQVLASRVIDNGPGWVGLLLDDAVDLLTLPGAGLPGAIGLVSRTATAGYDVELRAFFESNGIAVEDPVTGSLNAAVAQWLLPAGLLTAPYRAHQGTCVGADGVIMIEQDAGGQVWVGGRTQTMINGRVSF
ncbi:PhzF family phenazine biosynthesis protein [Microlunatus elymi]|uniref:PhzF family phenazine biosynthesis protein n=1 Tax=Microlunatus elymi TaxID=2596828 RepID=A0A516Q0E0_9ACTN|nr:PhzF family phenazine biosynthesis protein [Microlunatus elymi]QDP96894.1 PhzF family phenazine biosynthesis protein [Microlunatus elymi]